MTGTIWLLWAALLILCTAAWTAFCGWQWGWGPFAGLHRLKTGRLPGNAARYAPAQTEKIDGSPLAGKHLVFLGSSVTCGAAAGGVSFADCIAVRHACTVTKEAVCGTTLTDSGAGSYIARLKKLDVPAADLFICQLSTNDATQGRPLGRVSDSLDIESFDTAAVAGAIEYIIAYAKQTWGCPVVFYTNPRYDSKPYAAMAALLAQIADKWKITVIDMWHDGAFNTLTAQQCALYMADSIHPTRAGYLAWWTPYMEKFLTEVLR